LERLSQEQERLSSIVLPLLGALFQRNVRYSDSKRQSKVSSTLKKKLAALESDTHGKLRCMLLNELLPYSSVIAAHLLKREWDYLSRELADVDDVDNVRNGLLLYKPLEWAFDTCCGHLTPPDLCSCGTAPAAPSSPTYWIRAFWMCG
jgi:hypothetical protein